LALLILEYRLPFNYPLFLSIASIELAASIIAPEGA
jgi:hypothetical protein